MTPMIVIKLGGNAINENGIEPTFVQDVLKLHAAGKRVVLVHGGGPQVSAMLAKLGVTTQFVDGRRVTTREVRDVARMVLTGDVQRKIVHAINDVAPVAVGISGEDAHTFVSRQRDPLLGLVGDVERVNTALIETLLERRFVPVVSSIGPGVDGDVYNVNADSAAGAIAGALHSDEFLLLTDVAGIYANWPDPQSVIRETNAHELLALLPSLSEGMIPKVESCISALKDGAKVVRIVDGRKPHAIRNAAHSGTTVVA